MTHRQLRAGKSNKKQYGRCRNARLYLIDIPARAGKNNSTDFSLNLAPLTWMELRNPSLCIGSL